MYTMTALIFGTFVTDARYIGTLAWKWAIRSQKANSPSPACVSGDAQLYSASRNFNVNVLDSVNAGGPKLTVGRTIFELWLGTP